MVKKGNHLTYFFVIFFILIMYVSFLVIKPFITALVTAAILAYIFSPVYRRLNRRLKKPNLSATLISVLIIILVIIPMFFLATSAVEESKQIRTFYLITKQKIVTGQLFDLGCENGAGFLCATSAKLNYLMEQGEMKAYLESAILKIASAVVTTTSSFLLSIPFIILNLLIVGMATFYFLKEGKVLVYRIQNLLPLKPVHQREIMRKFNEISYALIYGQVIVAISEGLVAAVIFSLADVGSPLLWAAVVTILAFIPVIGGTLIWVPALIIKMAAGESGSALIILVGGVIISVIDNLARPKIIGQRAQIHPVIILIGVLGGLKLFGVLGFIIGPVILALFLTFVRIYESEKDEIAG